MYIAHLFQLAVLLNKLSNRITWNFTYNGKCTKLGKICPPMPSLSVVKAENFSYDPRTTDV